MKVSAFATLNLCLLDAPHLTRKTESWYWHWGKHTSTLHLPPNIHLKPGCWWVSKDWSCEQATRCRALSLEWWRNQTWSSYPLMQLKHSDLSVLEFYIMESNGLGIVGLASCKQLDIVHWQCDDIGVNTMTTNQQQSNPSSSGQSFKG